MINKTPLSDRKCLFIDKQGLFDSIVNKMLERAENEKFAVSIDTETSVNEPRIRLATIQMTMNNFNLIFDAVKIDIESFKHVLAHNNIIKVIHYSQYEKRVFNVYGWGILNIFDTYKEYKKKDPDSKGKSFSLKNLVKRVLGVDISKGEQTSNWFRRPLTDSQLLYGYMDSELAMMLYEKFEYYEIPFEENENKIANMALVEEYKSYGE